jgi:hypothetical protein
LYEINDDVGKVYVYDVTSGTEDHDWLKRSKIDATANNNQTKSKYKAHILTLNMLCQKDERVALAPAFMDGWVEHDKWSFGNSWILSPRLHGASTIMLFTGRNCFYQNIAGIMSCWQRRTTLCAPCWYEAVSLTISNSWVAELPKTRHVWRYWFRTSTISWSLKNCTILRSLVGIPMSGWKRLLVWLGTKKRAWSRPGFCYWATSQLSICQAVVFSEHGSPQTFDSWRDDRPVCFNLQRQRLPLPALKRLKMQGSNLEPEFIDNLRCL